MSLLDNLFTLSSQLNGYLAKLAGAVNDDGRVAVDLDGTTLSGDINAIVSDETDAGTLTALNDEVTVAMEGRPYAGLAVGAGFTGVLTCEASLDDGASWASVQTYSLSTAPPTISGATLTLSGSAAGRGIIVPIGATHVRARVSTATSGSCTATIRATVAGALHVFPQLDTVGALLTTLAGAIASTRMNVTIDATALGKLDSIIAAQGVPAGGPKFGYVGGITTGGNTTFPTKSLSRGTTVYNLDATNNLLIRLVGGDPGATQADTLTIKPGGSAWITCSNADAFNMRSSVGTIAACHSGS